MAEVEFRDETREIPDYMADLMAGIETWKITYDEAVVLMNRRLEQRQLTQAHDEILRSHFSGVPR